MIRRRAAGADIATKIGNHTFCATGITAYVKNGGTLEKAANMANHASTRTTQLYDRRRDDVSLDEVERILIRVSRLTFARVLDGGIIRRPSSTGIFVATHFGQPGSQPISTTGTLENAQLMAAHERPRATKLYDRTGDEITLDEIEKVVN